MEVLQAIYSRHSISAVKPDPVPRELVEKILSAAVQAPNHHHVRPWRFVVLEGSTRQRLGEVMAQSLLKRQPDIRQEILDIERAKPMRAPLLIAVCVDKPVESKVIEIENVCAAAAAIQNLLLAAHDLGLAAYWRTGPAAYDPEVKAFLGYAPDQHLIGFLYIGYPIAELVPHPRPGYEDRTVWMD